MMPRRHNARLTVMIAGQKGCGKSSFLNSIVGKEIVKKTCVEEIEIYMLNLECNGTHQKISFIDTPGFGDNMDDEELQDMIVDYIKDQFDMCIEEETKIRRNAKYEDTRVHCLVYMIPSSGHGLKQRDIAFLKKISGLVNIIPVISKADGLIETEIPKMKRLVRDQMEFYRIRVFDLEDEEYVTRSVAEQRLNACVPFACVFPEGADGAVRTRNHVCGVVETDDPKHNDFPQLKTVLLSTHADALIDVTVSELYEKYRSETLESILKE